MRRLILVAGLLLLVAAVVALSWVSRATPHVRDRVVAALNENFASQVAIDELQASVFPRPQLSGAGLTLRHNGRTDVPPLIEIESFFANAGVRGLLRDPLHLREISLEGLEIRVPAGGIGTGQRDDVEHEAHAVRPSPILIDTIVSRSARLEIASGRPGRLPRLFQIHDLVMRDYGRPEGSRFEAGLTNPMPRGRIETSGVFGPWHADEPGLTPVRGEYAFKNANLDDIKGIGGTLSSLGAYRGVLERIEVDGQTETPDFSIDTAGQPVSLRTRFTAIVDGTNGDTFLERVEAHINESLVIAEGEVVRTKDVKGRRVSLDVTIENARIEDLMRLAVKSDAPPLTGRVDMVTTFLLPAGDADVIDRLRLEGRFQLAQARFTSVDVQKKIATLSLRGRGQESAVPDGHSVVSNLSGRFVLRNSALSFQSLTFAVPGAVVQLSGTYDLMADTLAFTGDLLTDATLADMTSGIKSLLARVAQPLFRRKGGGSKLPIKITGPRAKPSFGLDMGRVIG
jgi:hypothetical protein